MKFRTIAASGVFALAAVISSTTQAHAQWVGPYNITCSPISEYPILTTRAIDYNLAGYQVAYVPVNTAYATFDDHIRHWMYPNVSGGMWNAYFAGTGRATTDCGNYNRPAG